MANHQLESLYFVTGNTSKVDEYRELLGCPGMKWISLKIPQEAEASVTLLAEAKLRYAKEEIDKYPFFVEESGLSIPAWNDLPGTFSYIFINQLGCELFCRMMTDFRGAERSARITKVIHYARSPRSRVTTFSGQLAGTIATEPRGKSGFGWDHIFVPDLPNGNALTLSELGREEKNRLLGGYDPARSFRDFLHPVPREPKADVRTTRKQDEARPLRKILILASNPRDTERLRLDHEVRRIEQGLERARMRDQFALIPKWAVTDDDLRRALLDHEPEIVHFAGHGHGHGGGGAGRDLGLVEGGGPGGLAFEEESGGVRVISTDSLAQLFKLCAGHVRCVVLNACYSAVQGEAIARHIEYVVGMKAAIGDEAAVKFSVGFYDALGAGRDFDNAYKFGCVSIELKGISEHLTPVLLRRTDRRGEVGTGE